MSGFVLHANISYVGLRFSFDKYKRRKIARVYEKFSGNFIFFVKEEYVKVFGTLRLSKYKASQTPKLLFTKILRYLKNGETVPLVDFVNTFYLNKYACHLT